ncbi:MAG: winged helix-turn-helix domain-containing protein [Candidatus Kaelpia aquatica]|nr:winged helix-turn-helix domain-containing protein [Candidatus Kaelpia aquatica]
MITEVGIVAGEIWNYLDKNGKVSLRKLTSNIEKPKDVILMSLGWLAREGHVVLEGNKDYKISLRE